MPEVSLIDDNTTTAREVSQKYNNACYVGVVKSNEIDAKHSISKHSQANRLIALLL